MSIFIAFLMFKRDALVEVAQSVVFNGQVCKLAMREQNTIDGRAHLAYQYIREESFIAWEYLK